MYSKVFVAGPSNLWRSQEDVRVEQVVAIGIVENQGPVAAAGGFVRHDRRTVRERRAVAVAVVVLVHLLAGLTRGCCVDADNGRNLPLSSRGAVDTHRETLVVRGVPFLSEGSAVRMIANDKLGVRVGTVLEEVGVDVESSFVVGCSVAQAEHNGAREEFAHNLINYQQTN